MKYKYEKIWTDSLTGTRSMVGIANSMQSSVMDSLISTRSMAGIANSMQSLVMDSLISTRSMVGLDNIFQIQNTFSEMKEILDIYGECYFTDEDKKKLNYSINLEEERLKKGLISKFQIMLLCLIISLTVSIGKLHIREDPIEIHGVVCETLNTVLGETLFSPLWLLSKIKEDE